MQAFFASDLLFYSLMALIIATPLIILVASLRGTRLATARRQTMKFLEDWASLAPAALKGKIAATIGFSGGFIFLMLLAYGFNSVGMILAPQLSRIIDHAGIAKTRYYVEDHETWKLFEQRFQIQAKKEDPNFDWWVEKTKLGKPVIRAFRILILAGLCLMFAGGFDLMSKTFRKRGLALLGIGALVLICSVGSWAQKISFYMNRLHSANGSLEASVAMPEEASKLFEY